MPDWTEEDDSAWEERRASTGLDRRREQRLSLCFPIEVSGLDRQREFFSEKTSTDDISEHGCRFRIRRELLQNALVTVRLAKGVVIPDASVAVDYRIARIEKTAEGAVVGAAKSGPGNLWCVSFPDTKRARS